MFSGCFSLCPFWVCPLRPSNKGWRVRVQTYMREGRRLQYTGTTKRDLIKLFAKLCLALSTLHLYEGNCYCDGHPLNGRKRHRHLEWPFSFFPPWQECPKTVSTLNGRLPWMSSCVVFPLESPLENSPLRKGQWRGDTISCDAPYSAIGFRGQLLLRYPPSQACLWTAVGHTYRKKWGWSSDSLRYRRKDSATGVVWQVSCDGGEGYFGRVTKPQMGENV